MRVNQTSNNQVQDANAHRTGKAGNAQQARDGKRTDTAGATDSTVAVKPEISARGKDIAHASAIASAAPDVREDKIAELKKRIAEGSYKVDANAVADRLVNEHLATTDLG